MNTVGNDKINNTNDNDNDRWNSSVEESLSSSESESSSSSSSSLSKSSSLSVHKHCYEPLACQAGSDKDEHDSDEGENQQKDDSSISDDVDGESESSITTTTKSTWEKVSTDSETEDGNDDRKDDVDRGTKTYQDYAVIAEPPEGISTSCNERLESIRPKRCSKAAVSNLPSQSRHRHGRSAHCQLHGRRCTEKTMISDIVQLLSSSHVRCFEIKDTYLSERIMGALLETLLHRRQRRRRLHSIRFHGCAMDNSPSSRTQQILLFQALLKECSQIAVINSHPNLLDLCNAAPHLTIREEEIDSYSCKDTTDDMDGNKQIFCKIPSSRTNKCLQLRGLRYANNILRESDVMSLVNGSSPYLFLQLEQLSFQNCYFDMQATKRELIIGLCYAPKLRVLNLSGCRLEDCLLVEFMELLLLQSTSFNPEDYSLLPSSPSNQQQRFCLANSLRNLDIGCNQCISMDSLFAIANFIRSPCCQLVSLNLQQMWKYRVERNVDLSPLIDALGETKSLRRLKLIKNELGDDEIFRLARIMRTDDKNYDKLSGSIQSAATADMNPSQRNNLEDQNQPPRQLEELLDLRENPGISAVGMEALLDSFCHGWKLQRIRLTTTKHITREQKLVLQFRTHCHWAMPRRRRHDDHYARRGTLGGNGAILGNSSHTSNGVQQTSDHSIPSRHQQQVKPLVVGLWPHIIARVNARCDTRYHARSNIPSVIYTILRTPNEYHCSAVPLISSCALQQ